MIQDDQEWPRKDISQLSLLSWVNPIRSHRYVYPIWSSMPWPDPLPPSVHLPSRLSPFFVTRDSWRAVLPVLTDVKKEFNTSCLFPVLYQQILGLIQQWVHIFQNLSFVTCVLLEALFTALDILVLIPLELGFSFPIFFLTCSDKAFVFLSGYLFLFPPSLCFFSALEFGEKLLVHPCRPLAVFTWLCFSWVGLPLMLEGVVLEY